MHRGLRIAEGMAAGNETSPVLAGEVVQIDRDRDVWPRFGQAADDHIIATAATGQIAEEGSMREPPTSCWREAAVRGHR